MKTSTHIYNREKKKKKLIFSQLGWGKVEWDEKET